MDRPYIVCHILASLDGRISGSFMGTDACAPAWAEAPGGAAAELELKRAETLDGGAVHLVYAVR